MPAKNVRKIYLPDTYYHVYNRGVNKQPIFLDDQDYTVFLSLLKRYLDPSAAHKRSNGVHYAPLYEKVNLLAYCLMPNHFHLFLYQYTEDGMSSLLRNVSVSYGMYFNHKYSRVGPIFQQRYRAVRITDDAQLMHITRYIHLNPDTYARWPWSSLKYYDGSTYAKWLSTSRVLELFDYDPTAYRKFIDDYKDKHDELELLKSELAG